jgi:hypothetical protein
MGLIIMLLGTFMKVLCKLKQVFCPTVATETADYREAKNQKGFLHVKVNGKGEVNPETIELTSTRRFIILDQDFPCISSAKITESVVQMVKENDSEGAVIIPILKGTLPAEASRGEIDIAKIRSAGEKALLVHPIVLLKETAVSDEIVRSIFEANLKFENQSI